MTQATATPPVTEDVPVIKIGNATFRLIFHNLYRPLTDGEYAGLKDSIERHGIRQDITVFSRGNLVFDVIDGAHRVRAASELGFHLHQVPYKHATGTPEELRALAETLNEDRRQLTVEERRERALKLRQQGQSYRQIGEALGVSQMTARADVEAAGVNHLTPATVTGKDGKAYPATAPEISESEIAIVRDLVAEVLPSWTKPIEAGHITNAVRRRPGGAEVSVRAVRAALERMIEAGNVVKLKNAQNCTVYALTHDPAIKLDEQGSESPAPESAGEPIAPLSMGGAEIADWLGKRAEKPAPDKTQTQTDATKISMELVSSAPLPVTLEDLRQRTALSEERFTKARNLLQAAGEVAQEGKSLKLVVKPAPAPVSAPPSAPEDPAPAPTHENGMDVHYSSKSDDWHTPADVIKRVQQVLGAIDLDPCSNAGAPNVPAAQHYTRDDDGLAQEWSGRVFMNPPYGREIAQWVEKLVSEHKAGRVTQAIALVPARTDTAWFAALRDFPRCFIAGRLTFLKPDGSEADPAPFPSCAIYIGPDLDRFAEHFASLGDIYVRYTPEG